VQRFRRGLRRKRRPDRREAGIGFQGPQKEKKKTEAPKKRHLRQGCPKGESLFRSRVQIRHPCMLEEIAASGNLLQKRNNHSERTDRGNARGKGSYGKETRPKSQRGDGDSGIRKKNHRHFRGTKRERRESYPSTATIRQGKESSSTTICYGKEKERSRR